MDGWMDGLITSVKKLTGLKCDNVGKKIDWFKVCDVCVYSMYMFCTHVCRYDVVCIMHV